MEVRRRRFVQRLREHVDKVSSRVLVFRASHGSPRHAEELMRRIKEDPAVMEHIQDEHIQKFADHAPESRKHLSLLSHLFEKDPERVMRNITDEHIRKIAETAPKSFEHLSFLMSLYRKDPKRVVQVLDEEHIRGFLARSRPPSIPESREDYYALLASIEDEKYYHFARRVLMENPDLGKRIIDYIENIARDEQYPVISRVKYGKMLLDLKKDLEHVLKKGVDPEDESFKITAAHKQAAQEMLEHLSKKDLDKIRKIVEELEKSEEFKRALDARSALGTLSKMYG